MVDNNGKTISWLSVWLISNYIVAYGQETYDQNQY